MIGPSNSAQEATSADPGLRREPRSRLRPQTVRQTYGALTVRKERSPWSLQSLRQRQAEAKEMRRGYNPNRGMAQEYEPWTQKSHPHRLTRDAPLTPYGRIALVTACVIGALFFIWVVIDTALR